MRMRTIGNSTIALFKAEEAVNITSEALKKDPEIGLDKRIRIGVIGCGRIAGVHINGYARNNNVELVAFCDIKEDNAQQRAHRFNARSYTDYKKMIKEENLDGVSICTPPFTHKEIAIEALNKGINVLCEKPLAVSVNEAKEMVEAARNNGVLLLSNGA